MTVLSDPDRVTVWRILMQRGECPGAILKTDFRAAVNASDDWVDGNATASTNTAFNTALPVAYRNAATAGQKAALIAAVTLKRYGRDF